MGRDEFSFTLKKKEEGPFWPQLTKGDVRQQNVKIDVNRWKDEDDSGSEDDMLYGICLVFWFWEGFSRYSRFVISNFDRCTILFGYVVFWSFLISGYLFKGLDHDTCKVSLAHSFLKRIFIFLLSSLLVGEYNCIIIIIIEGTGDASLDMMNMMKQMGSWDRWD